MNPTLDQKVALVTGASSGLGRRFAVTLARAGAKVAVAARRADRLAELAAEITGFGGQALAVGMDVTRIESIREAVTAAEAGLGPIDILVNNAGVTVTKPILDVTGEDYDFVFDTNAKGLYFVAQAVARGMIQRGGGGNIVNLGSVASLRVLGKLSLYCGSKAAVAHMSRAMALEWGRHDINVNAICPGYIETELNRDYWQTEGGQALIKRLPRRRLGDPADLDGILLLLAGPAGRFINGAVIPVDDGTSIQF